MSILIRCSSCGKNLRAADSAAGKRVKCPGCGTVLDVPAQAVEELAAVEAAPDPPAAAAPPAGPPPLKPPPLRRPPAPAAPSGSALRSMQCKGCGGTVEFQDGQGLFKCKYCGSVYESEPAAGGGSTVRAIKIIEQKLDSIEGHTKTSADAASEERLRKKAAQVQDKIDFKWVEFDNSLAKKMAGASVILGVIGVIVIFAGFGKDNPTTICLLAGAGLIALGVFLFRYYKSARAAMEIQCAEMKQAELEPIYAKLRELGAALGDGTVSLGYTESTSVPQRYCIFCHQNVMPQKKEGGSLAGLTGMNLLLVFMTCGMWLPAMFFIEILARGGKMAGSRVQKGACPQCGNQSLFPARIENV